MPPTKRARTSFSITGRYLINVAERKQFPIYHDIENLKPECGFAEVPQGQISRFNSTEWARYRGYKPCSHCAKS